MSDEETPAPKKIHEGYHGWMKTIPKTSQDIAPKKIESHFHVEVKPNGNSAWNSAGTWEERDKSVWGRERLKHHILNSFHVVDDVLKLSIKTKSIVRCDGEAKLVFSRGKKRCGYDISLKFEWESSRQGEDPEGMDEVSGHIEIHDFDDTTGEDYEVKVTVEGNSQHEREAKQLINKWEPELRKILAAWKQELLAQ